MLSQASLYNWIFSLFSVILFSCELIWWHDLHFFQSLKLADKCSELVTKELYGNWHKSVCRSRGLIKDRSVSSLTIIRGGWWEWGGLKMTVMTVLRVQSNRVDWSDFERLSKLLSYCSEMISFYLVISVVEGELIRDNSH